MAEQDLVVRFIGLDLLSNVANNAGYGINRLASRINSLSGISSQQYAAMARAQQNATSQMVENEVARAAASVQAARAVDESKQLQYASVANLEQLEQNVANRRSLRAAEDVRLNAQIADSRDRMQLMERQGLTNSMQYTQLAGQVRQAEEAQVSNALLNEVDNRQVYRAKEQVALDANRVKMSQSNASLVESENAYSTAVDRQTQQRTAARIQEEEQSVASQRRLQGAITNVGSMAVMTGAAMVVAAAGIAAGMAYAADQSAKFEQQLLLIQTQAGATSADVNLMRTATMELGPQFGFTATQAAQAAFHIESVGLRGAAAVDALKFSMMGARVGAADLEDTANMLAVIMASHIVPAGQSAETTMATLNAIIGQGNMRMDQLSSAFKTGLVGALELANIKLTDAGAAIATLTDLGYTGATAGTALRSAITMIASPTNVATKLLKDMGFSVEEVSSAHSQMANALLKAGINVTQFAETIRTQGIEAGLELLRQKMIQGGLTADEQSAVITKAFGGSRIGSAFKVLYESLDRLDMREKNIAADATAKKFEDAWAATSDLLTTKMSQLESSLQNIVIALGEALTPTVIAIMGAVQDFLGPVLDWIVANKTLIAQLAPLLIGALALGGALLIIVGALAVFGTMLASVIGAMATIGPVLLIAAAVASVVGEALAGAAIIAATAWNKLAPLWDSEVVPAARRIWNAIQDIWTAIQIGIKDVMPYIQSAFEDFGTQLTNQGSIWQTISDAFGEFSRNLVTFIKSDTFASLIATFAVSIPAAVRITLDSIALIVDAFQIVLIEAITTAKVTADALARNWTAMKADALEGGKEIEAATSRMGSDMNQLMTDTANQFNGTNRNMWLQVYYDTLHFTQQIGDDGATELNKGFDKLSVAQRTQLNQWEATMRANGVTLTQAMIDGEIQGILNSQAQLDNAMKQSTKQAVQAAKTQARVFSPSGLTREELGIPLAQGVAQGILDSTGLVNASMGKLVGAATSPSGGAITGVTAASTPLDQILTVSQETRDILGAIEAAIAEYAREHPATPSTTSPGGGTSGTATDSTLLATLYGLLNNMERNRRRGIAAYGTSF